ncbi:PIN domain-containing protein [Nocardia neocaledoniensis]|jgi:predicted nucleic acid-binding protein|uniref:PIN domain-containing protein n=1 Tax=Nocardia TaxID=1817 RepID=UPI001E54F10E|nr:MULTISPECIES: PIN domain-containing protein [Nocardia]UGT58201.1 PIN domain-containing protein [Nocardia asteroides]
MAVTARYLLDTSAAARMPHKQVAAELAPLIKAGLVATCAPLDSEALYSARNPTEYEEIRSRRREAYEYLPTNDEHWHSAFVIQRELARSGRHRAVGIHDLLAAVVAVEHRLVLVHYDADFEAVASIVDLNHRWIAPRGTLGTS